MGLASPYIRIGPRVAAEREAWPQQRRYVVAPNPVPGRVGSLNRLFTRTAKTAGEGAGPLSMTCQTSAGIARAGGLPAPASDADRGMKSDIACHLGGVRRQALEVARAAAHHCGMSIDEWLDRIILDSARQQGIEPTMLAGPRSDSCDQDDVAARTESPSCPDMATDKLRDDVAGIAVMLLNRASQKRSPELEGLIKALIDRIERGELARRAHSPLGRLEELIAKLI